MKRYRILAIVAILCALSATGQSADIILNEYSAVDSNDFLNGGDAAVDEDGGRAFDSYFGRVRGNGGDWFEMVVITDHLDIRGWHLNIYEDGILDETLDLTDHVIWSDLRSGTIITVSEDVPSDVSYNPEAGDWWINVQANNNADGLFIEASSFPVSSDDWQLTIRDADGAVVFGPAGEGVSPDGGVGGKEVFRLEGNPNASVTPDSNDYDDGADYSTFGAPNRWGSQSFKGLCKVVDPAPATLTVLSPAPAAALESLTVTTIEWETEGVVDEVLVEFSLDGGVHWAEVYPPNVGNTGVYDWAIPAVSSDDCLIRLSNAMMPAVNAVSSGTFTIF